MFPQEFFLKTNALRLILGHFLVHMHNDILANTLHSSKRLCKIDVYFVVIMPNNVNTEWILGGGKMLWGGISQVPPPMNPCTEDIHVIPHRDQIHIHIIYSMV